MPELEVWSTVPAEARMAAAEAALEASRESAPVAVRPTERTRAIGVSLAVFVVTFIVYWLLGPFKTPYDFQLSQANNIIHGHLDMTAEYTRNLYVLERVLYDGQGFCLPTNDPRGPEMAALLENPRFSDACKHYMQHSLGPAFLLVPVVLVFGLDVSQTLISALVGAATAVVVFAIVRRFSSDLRTQLALTVLAVFGTTFWYSAADGGVWHFAHTTTVFFLFAAIYATVGLRRPLLAGAFIGAAFMCRPSTLLAGMFPLVAFSDLWLPAAAEGGKSLLARVRLRPLVELAVGVTPFIIFNGAVNYLRFGNPLESGYSYGEQIYQTNLRHVYEYGLFNVNYLGRHVAIFFEQMPLISREGSFVYPSWAGVAMWVTSPALLLGLFVHLRRFTSVARLAAVAVALAAGLMLVSQASQRLGFSTWSVAELPFGLHLWPFGLLIGLAISLAIGLRDRLVLACWAAILPIVFFNWMFAATGWAQFGYRYALDFMPFVFMLAVLMVRSVRRYQLLLIGAAVLVNLWGVLWIFKFAPAQLFGWTWVGW